MGGYLAYTEYKESEVDALGQLPTHWTVMPIKFSLAMPITDGPHETPKLYDTGVTFISAEAIKNDEIDFEKKCGFISIEEHQRFSKKYNPKRGDVYMVKSGATTGNVARVETDNDFNIWSPLAALRPDHRMTATNFLFYVMKSKPFFYAVELSWNFGTQQNIGMGVISNIRIALPALPEQQQIAAFLDYKTAQIDALIAKKEALLEKLAEKRTALISQAVTKGLDPTVEMKDSGVEWLGEIPKNWHATKLKYYAYCFNGSTPKTTNPDYWEDGVIPWLSSGKVNEDRVMEPSKYISQKAFNECSLRMVPRGSIVIGIVGQGKTRGTSAYLEIEATINQNMAAIVPKSNIDSRFLHFYLQQAYEPIRNFGRGANQPALDVGLVGLIPISLPPYEDQVQITKFLEESEIGFTETYATVSNAIERLKEYRTALITNTVTGKIDVRDIKIPDPTLSNAA